MNLSGSTVSDLGENRLLERIAARLPGGGMWLGDDAAVIPAPSSNLLFSVDTVVEGIDFDLSYSSGEDIGWKALAVNVSDMAAMAGHPAFALVSLTLRDDTPIDVFDGILDGFASAAAEFGVELVGGDLSGGNEISLSVPVVGAPGASGVLKRSGARVGQAICVSGSLGGAAAGLEVLRRGLRGPRPETGHSQSYERLALRQLRPRPRVGVAKALAGYGASTMIDISDGLAIDLDRLMHASRKGCSITSAAIPVDPDARGLGESLSTNVFDPLKAAIVGGEDFEILCTLDVDRFEAARRAVLAEGAALTSIGVVTQEGLTIDDGTLDDWKEESWEHLRNR